MCLWWKRSMACWAIVTIVSVEDRDMTVYEVFGGLIDDGNDVNQQKGKTTIGSVECEWVLAIKTKKGSSHHYWHIARYFPISLLEPNVDQSSGNIFHLVSLSLLSPLWLESCVSLEVGLLTWCLIPNDSEGRFMCYLTIGRRWRWWLWRRHRRDDRT